MTTFEEDLQHEIDVTNHQRRVLLRFMAIQLVVLILILSTVILSSWQGRVDQVESNRRGCERSKLDRGANARAWREAQRARTRDGDFDTAALYRDVADQLERRSLIRCSEAFPDPPVVKLFADV